MLDPAVESVPARIRVFESMLDKRASTKAGSTPAQDLSKQRGGVSIMLLDYLVITSLLLVTTKDEYATINITRSVREPTESLPGPETGPEADTGMSHSGPVSVKQWRKIVYGEPLFPTLKVPKGPQPAPDDDPGDGSSIKSRPASMKQWRKIMYGEPLFPQNAQSKIGSDDDVDEVDESSMSDDDAGEEEGAGEGDGEEEEDAYTGLEEVDAGNLSDDGSDSFPYPISPMFGEDAHASMDSIPYPVTPISIAPAHGDMDPSFYDESSHGLYFMPPVPEIPLQYQSENYSPRIPSTRPNDPQPLHQSPLSIITNAASDVPNATHARPSMTLSSMPSSYSLTTVDNRDAQPWIQRSKSSPSMNGVPTTVQVSPPSSTLETSSSNPTLAPSSRWTGSSSRGSSFSQAGSSDGLRVLPAPPHSPSAHSIVNEKRRSTSMSQPQRPLRSLPPTPQATSAASADAQEYLARTLQKEANEHRWQQSHQRSQSLAPSIMPGDAPPAYHAIDFSAPSLGPHGVVVGSSSGVHPPTSNQGSHSPQQEHGSPNPTHEP